MARSRLCRHHVCHGAAGEPRLLPAALTRRRPSAPPASWKRNRGPDLDPTLSVVVAKHRQQRGSSKPAGRRYAPRPPAASGTTPPHRRRGATAAGCGTPRQSHPCALQSQPRRPTAAGRRRPRPPRQVPHGVPPVSSAESNLNPMRSGRLTSNGPSGSPHLVGAHGSQAGCCRGTRGVAVEPRDPLNLGAVTPNCNRTPPRRGRRRALPSNACCTMRLQCWRQYRVSLQPPRFGWYFPDLNLPIAAMASNCGGMTLHAPPLERGARPFDSQLHADVITPPSPLRGGRDHDAGPQRRLRVDHSARGATSTSPYRGENSSGRCVTRTRPNAAAKGRFGELGGRIAGRLQGGAHALHRTASRHRGDLRTRDRAPRPRRQRTSTTTWCQVGTATLEGGEELATTPSEWDGIIKARKLFFQAERALAKASLEYEKARIQYERACSQVGVTPHYAP